MMPTQTWHVRLPLSGRLPPLLLGVNGRSHRDTYKEHGLFLLQLV